MTTLPAHGILGIDLDRSPGPDDWLAVAIGSEQLVPVRTDFAPKREPPAVVVSVDTPPTAGALRLLEYLLADGSPQSIDRRRTDAPSRRWAVTAAARITAAVTGLHPDQVAESRRRAG